MNSSSKDVYYQRSRQAGQDHKQKYPGYVYNPKEARMRKALREQSRVVRNGAVVPSRWTKPALAMNRQPLVSSVLLSQLPRCTDNTKTMLHEQVDRDNMLQSYPDYLDLPYNIPSNEYSLDNQSWYPYVQGGAQGYMDRVEDTKLPVDWSTPYNSEQGNFIRASPQSSPYSMRNQPEVNSMLLNGDGGHSEQPAPCDTCLVADHKPIVDSVNSVCVKDPEQQVKDLLASVKVIKEGSPEVNGKQEDAGSTRLPGFHQAFGSTEIGRFSQPDGFFEAAVAAENERKTPEVSSLPLSPRSSAWNSSFFYPTPDLFGFQGDYMVASPNFNEPNHLYTIDDSLFNPDQPFINTEDPFGSGEFEPQDLSGVTNTSKPPVIISENDNCCVVLESSAMDNDLKEYFSL